jgi:hypothetical protein
MMPPTILTKDQLKIYAKMMMNVMDSELVLNMDGAKENLDE